MTIVWIGYWASAGLLAGSATWTLANNQIRGSILVLRPVCLACGVPLPLRRWLPLTWLTASGACPQCGDSERNERRAWEIAVAAYFVLALAVFEPELATWSVVIASLPLLLILAIDLKVQAVFVHHCYVAIVLGLFLGLTESPREAGNAMLGMLTAFVVAAFFLLITQWMYRSLQVRTMPMGLSDLYVGAAVGALVRADALLPALLTAVLLAAGYGIMTPVLRPQSRSRLAPFGPFLCVGGLMALAL